jgi:aspartate/methionine/tyrosine aminotransferase
MFSQDRLGTTTRKRREKTEALVVFSLPGIGRVGYAIAHEELATAFDKIRNHFGMSRISQAGALAALEDQEWLQHVRCRRRCRCHCQVMSPTAALCLLATRYAVLRY